MPMIESGQRALVNTDERFVAPDGGSYKAAWGRVTIHEAKTLFGFDPKAGANFYVQVGFGDEAFIVAGCRVHFAFPCEGKPAGAGEIYVPPSERPDA